MHDIYGVHYSRILNPGKTNSFFLFGARGTGKTTFLKSFFKNRSDILWLNLLDPEIEDRYSRLPSLLIEQIRSESKRWKWVIIDEVQKVPALLNCVHLLIEEQGTLFALTGSSARRLKRGGANLLAGRAFLNYLFPLTHRELGRDFNLTQALSWGTLPKAFQLTSTTQKAAYLRAYTLAYLKEEVWAEHLIKTLNPFRKFLEIAAQCNGEPLNFSNISRDCNTDTKTIQSYYQILEDTWAGYVLEPHHTSIRKRQKKAPKFYFFDTGICRALCGTQQQSLVVGTPEFGRAFEHFVLLEIFRLNEYGSKDYSFSYLRTKDQAEVDLIIARPGMPVALVEIKSTDRVDERHTRGVQAFLKDFRSAEAFCLSRDPIKRKIGSVRVLPWEAGLIELGL